jgi:hypothetical protein
MKISESDKLQEVTLGPIKIKDGLFMGDELAAKVPNLLCARILSLLLVIK